MHLLFVQSEAESKEGNGLKLVGSNRKGGLVGSSENGVTDQVKDLRTWSSRHLSVEVSDSFAATLVSSFLTGVCLRHIRNIEMRNNLLIVYLFSDHFVCLQPGLQTQTCDDEASTASSGFGSDEKTIKAVFEQMKVRYKKVCIQICLD